MKAAIQWRAGVASDTGLVRASNEDRYWIDDENGAFLVVDGVGGQPAGETAAEMAVEVIREELRAQGAEDEGPENRVRRAITAANNHIFAHAREADDREGMACVLTLALIDDGEMVIGHVGDSRLYLIWNGSIRKLTSDHSPVGEDEDAGALTEEEAMLHPRRNEVFRDVGTRFHEPADADFIDVRRCAFKPEAAFLLCSDGLSDALPSATIRELVERYQGDPGQVAQDLVEAANEAGGKDNVTALFVAGSEFRGRTQPAILPVRRDAQARHTTTRMRPADAAPTGARRIFSGRVAFLLYGILVGLLLGAVLEAALRVLKG